MNAQQYADTLEEALQRHSYTTISRGEDDNLSPFGKTTTMMHMEGPAAEQIAVVVEEAYPDVSKHTGTLYMLVLRVRLKNQPGVLSAPITITNTNVEALAEKMVNLIKLFIELIKSS